MSADCDDCEWSYVMPNPHECGANLIFTDHELKPYFGLDSLVKSGDGSVSGSLVIDGEQWGYTLSFSKSGFKPRAHEDFKLETVREFEISFVAMDDVGERGGTFHISPRWPDMESKEGAKTPSTPDILGINVRINASNVELDEYPSLLWLFFDDLGLNSSYVENIHEYSNIWAYERYLRLLRSRTRPIVGSGGTLERIFEFAAAGSGNFRELRMDDTKIQGYHNRITVDSRGAADLLDRHSFAKKIKHYHPEHVRKDPADPLYHPKLGVSLAKKWNDSGTVPWSRRHELERELDEALLNIVNWSGLRVDPSGPYFSDAYFSVSSITDAELGVSLVDDPTPRLEREQDAVVSGHLMSMTDSDEDTLKVMTDGGTPTVSELADEAGWSQRTIYRVLDRLADVLKVDAGEVEFSSRHLRQQVCASLETAADGIDKDTSVSNSLRTMWRNQYGVDIADGDDRLVMRFGDIGGADIHEILKEGLTAWERSAKDVSEFLKGKFRFEKDGYAQVKMGFDPSDARGESDQLDPMPAPD